ncbi:unnamed protein product [Diabrotica balteata]|uniref:THAP-type domain-containing protein n=1 Tax=Diabrotica balteata TaxID=107213 RepID=A0A9N9T3Z7_DIABA|nr:unnamed protein product [Diabrotica balteata]
MRLSSHLQNPNNNNTTPFYFVYDTVFVYVFGFILFDYQKDAKMHIFPKNQELYNVWIQRIGHQNLQEMPMEKVRKSYRVCNVHFGPDAQYIGLINKSTIKKDTIRSLFLPPSKYVYVLKIILLLVNCVVNFLNKYFNF